MPVLLALGCVGFLLGLAVLGVLISQARNAALIIYFSALTVSVFGCVNALSFLLGSLQPSAIELPLGLPWLGAHFRIDALSSFFLVLVNLGAAAASLFAVGYGHHEENAGRVLPFYPAFLAGMKSRRPRRRRVQFSLQLGAYVARLLGPRHGAP